MTEASAGSDLAGMTSRAVRDGDHYVLSGSKTFISNAVIADGFVVAARTGEGRHDMSLFGVEAAWEGFQRGRNLKKMGMAAQDTAELFFDDVAVPVENLLGEEGQGFGYLMHGLAEERVSCAVQSLANAEYALSLTLDYVKERTAFGSTIGSFQNTQFTLAELRARMDMAQAFVDNLVHAINVGDHPDVEAAGAKLLCSELQGDVVDECLQFFGGHGYMDEFPISRLYTDASVARIFGGTSEIMKMIIARDLGLR
jgi:alkylation response protein AidB-like acyl-CoA dehydrogenase